MLSKLIRYLDKNKIDGFFVSRPPNESLTNSRRDLLEL